MKSKIVVVGKSLTFLPSSVLQLRVPGNHDNFDHEAVATLPNHVDHLTVANLHHVLAIHLKNTNSLRDSFWWNQYVGKMCEAFLMSHIMTHVTESGNLL